MLFAAATVRLVAVIFLAREMALLAGVLLDLAGVGQFLHTESDIA